MRWKHYFKCRINRPRLEAPIFARFRKCSELSFPRPSFRSTVSATAITNARLRGLSRSTVAPLCEQAALGRLNLRHRRKCRPQLKASIRFLACVFETWSWSVFKQELRFQSFSSSGISKGVGFEMKSCRFEMKRLDFSSAEFMLWTKVGLCVSKTPGN